MVLLADGSIKPIKDMQVGDQVAATDPATGATDAKPVTQLHINLDRDLTDVTVRNAKTGETSVIKTTSHHGEWVSAAGLAIGHQLLVAHDAKRLEGDSSGAGSGGGGPPADDNPATSDPVASDTVTVVAVTSHTGAEAMRDLTIADIHTYYVIAGNTPVLVHNCGPEIGPYASRGSGQDLRRSAMVGDDQWHFNTGHGFNRAHTGPGGVKNDLRITTLTPDQIEAAIVGDVYAFRAGGGTVPRAGSAGLAGPLERYVDVGGANIGYRVSRSPDGAFRVGIYWNNSW